MSLRDGQLPRITVAIPTYNRPALLRQALETLVRQDYPADRVEILVIDNNSPPETREVVAAFKDAALPVKWILEAQQGLNYGRNRAVREARGEIIVFGDDDILAPPDWLRLMAMAFGEVNTHRVAALGGTVIPLFLEPCPDWLPSWKNTWTYGDQLGILPDRHFPMGANMAIARWVFDEVGLFRPDLDRKGDQLASGGETELFRRIRGAGHKIWFEPAAAVQHQMPPGRLTLKYACRHAYDSARSRVVDRVKYQSPSPREALCYLATRWWINAFKLPFFACLSGLSKLCFLTTSAKGSWVRTIRCWGYLKATQAAIFTGLWRDCGSGQREGKANQNPGKATRQKPSETEIKP